LGDFVHKLVSHSLGARAQGESGDDLGASVARDPQPGRFGGAAQFQAQFVELDMGELQAPHEPLM